MKRRTIVLMLVAALLLALPEVVLACPACITTAENRLAFVETAVLLSLLPLGIVGGTGLWLRKRSREADELDFDADSK